MEVNNLNNTKVFEKYERDGFALIKRSNQELTALIYSKELSLKAGMDLINEGYEFGMCSNHEFIIKERFGNE